MQFEVLFKGVFLLLVLFNKLKVGTKSVCSNVVVFYVSKLYFDNFLN